MKKYLSILLAIIMAFTLTEPMYVHAEEGVRPELIYPTGDLKKPNLYEVEPGQELEDSGQKIERYAETEFSDEIELYYALEQMVKEAILEGADALFIEE